MAGKATGLLDDEDQSICGRCGGIAAVQARSERMCKQCFMSYVKTKVIKKMESFRVRNKKSDQRRRLLLALSLGVSSVSLLHVLDQHIERQIGRTGRAGFDLHILLVIDPGEEVENSRLSQLQERYPRHEYTVTDLEPAPSTPWESRKDASSTVMLNALASSTSRSDMLQIQRTNQIAKYATDEGCECILWGHSTTTLAEKVLAETSKGRGFALPWLVNDGSSPLGVTFMFPMRDLLRKEVQLFADLNDPPLSPVCPPKEIKRAQVSSKGATIDSLMKDYFASVEENYPSIVANVVRTSGKLVASEPISMTRCANCNLPIEEGGGGLVGWAGERNIVNTEPQASYLSGLCYGCARLVEGSSTAKQRT